MRSEEPTQDHLALTVEELKQQLSEAHRQQTATANVLKVISRSAFDLQVVLDTLVESAARLCEADSAAIHRPKDGGYPYVASYGYSREYDEYMLARPIKPSRGTVLGRAVLEGSAIHVADVLTDPDYTFSEAQKIAGYRTVLGVPLMCKDTPIGVIILTRNIVRPFAHKQIELVTTYADQAVIAIENTRLFEEVQARSRELAESLEYQTATSEVLNVISRSPSQLQPVFDFIAHSASRLCGDEHAIVTRHVGADVHLVAQHNPRPGTLAEVAKFYPVPAAPNASVSARAVATGELVHIPDVEAEAFEASILEYYSRISARSLIGVPMIHQGRPIGSIAVSRATPGPFSKRQIDLLQTFADQAVIAIENTRLFEEVQARTRDLVESLQQQTATADVLKVISRSAFDLQTVLDTLVESAAHLCDAHMAAMLRQRGSKYEYAASFSVHAELDEYLKRVPFEPGRGTVTGRTLLERSVVHVPDAHADPELKTFEGVIRSGARTMLGVPLMREGHPIGVMILMRGRVEPFSVKEIDLVTTFADQAVIAMENTRLFEEVQARNRDLTALSEVGRAVSSTLNLKVVLKTVVERAAELSGTDAGSIFYYRPEFGRFELGETVGFDEKVIAKFRRLDILMGETGMGEAIAKREPLQIPDIAKRPKSPMRDAALEVGLCAALIVPLLGSEGALGALVLQRRSTGEFAPSVVSLMQAFADQSAIALENARLFNEIVQKSRELEIASQHKSQFVANMSHELRTPLAAILGYTELMQEGFYEPLGQRSMDALTRIRSNGRHLLGLINTVLDIAKIESGQFNLNLSEYALESVIETVRAATEALAETKRLRLKTDVAKRLPVGVGDEQRLTQVLLNLVGNAIKFTDKGEVRISAMRMNSHFAVSVTDTGPGIPIEEQTRIFEQFHQVDSSNTKAKGGTGLGLAIVKQIVEMHGGRIWVESTPGEGATFQMELPILAENRKAMA